MCDKKCVINILRSCKKYFVCYFQLFQTNTHTHAHTHRETERERERERGRYIYIYTDTHTHTHTRTHRDKLTQTHTPAAGTGAPWPHTARCQEQRMHQPNMVVEGHYKLLITDGIVQFKSLLSPSSRNSLPFSCLVNTQIHIISISLSLSFSLSL